MEQLLNDYVYLRVSEEQKIRVRQYLVENFQHCFNVVGMMKQRSAEELLPVRPSAVCHDEGVLERLSSEFFCLQMPDTVERVAQKEKRRRHIPKPGSKKESSRKRSQILEDVKLSSIAEKLPDMLGFIRPSRVPVEEPSFLDLLNQYLKDE